MGDAYAEEGATMKCSVKSCPGEYEARHVVHSVRYRGRVVVIDHVPVEVCSVCGDVLLSAEAVRRIEALLQTDVPPSQTVPLYEYA